MNILFLSNNLLSQNVENKGIKKVFTIEVLNIDSTKDYYIIYANSSERKFKIVTRKIDSDCRNVFITGRYTVTLFSFNENLPEWLKGTNPCDVHYGWLGDNIIRNEPEWECDIFSVDEIFGLCYTTDMDEINSYKEWMEQNTILSRSRWDTMSKGKKKALEKLRDRGKLSKREQKRYHIYY